VTAVPLLGRITSIGLLVLGGLIGAALLRRTAYAFSSFPDKPYFKWMV